MEWEKIKLGKILEVLTDYHANGSYEKLKENVELLDKSNYAVMIRTKNLESNDFQQDLKYITEPAYNFLKKSKVLPNDILMNKIANAGSVYLMPKIEKPVSLAMNLFLIRCMPNRANQTFIFYQLKYKENYIKRFTNGTATKTITKEAVRNLNVFLPSVEEQEKIARFLDSVTLRISQLRRKRELLETYKKGVMQKIFSQQIRFTQDNGKPFPDWEKKKLEELLTIRYGKDHKDLKDGKYPVLGTGGVMRYVDSYLYDKPSILIGRKGTIDKPQFISFPFWTVDTLFYSEIKPNIVPFFLFLIIQSINWYKYNEATGVPSLNTTSINNIKVLVPQDKEEQEKIASFLTSIDRKIDTVSKQIAKLEQFKQGLLQKMFM